MAATMCMMRNLYKLNGGQFLKATKLTASKSYSTLAGTPYKLGKRPLILLKNMKHQVSSCSLRMTARKMAGTAAGGGSHTALWTVEKILSATLLATMPAAFIFPSQVMDAILAVSLIMHSHWGIEAVFVDYLRPNVVGKVIPKLAHLLLFLVSISSLGGLFYLIHNDIGIVESIKRVWNAKKYYEPGEELSSVPVEDSSEEE